MVTSILVTYSGRSKIDRPKTNAFLKIHEFSSKISHNKRSKKWLIFVNFCERNLKCVSFWTATVWSGRKVLVTTIRCWWRFIRCHRIKVTNITMSATSVSANEIFWLFRTWIVYYIPRSLIFVSTGEIAKSNCEMKKCSHNMGVKEQDLNIIQLWTTF